MKISRELWREIFAVREGRREGRGNGNSFQPGLTTKTVIDWWDSGRKNQRRGRSMWQKGKWPIEIPTTAYILRGCSGRILLSFTIRDNGERIEGVTD